MKQNHYYPFGLKHESYNTQRLGYASYVDEDQIKRYILKEQPKFVGDGSYNYKYNGKEFQDELGLNMYDMDMRDYDPAIARWVNQDPVIHYDYSPYNAFDNNPVYWADPSGADAVYDWDAHNSGRKGVYRDGDTEVSFEEAMASNGVNLDDIIFRDKKGNKIATYYDGKKEIKDITLPIDNLGFSPNFSINNSLFNLDDIDVIGFSLSGSYADILGATAGVEFIYFLDGKNKNQIFSYTYGGALLGVSAEGGISIIGANFLGNDSVLSSDDYLGVFNSYSGRAGVIGATYFWGNNYNDPELYPGMASWWRENYQQTWSGISISKGSGTSLTVGTSNYFYTPFVNDLLKKVGAQK